jgi:hypothetical protein
MQVFLSTIVLEHIIRNSFIVNPIVPSSSDEDISLHHCIDLLFKFLMIIHCAWHLGELESFEIIFEVCFRSIVSSALFSYILLEIMHFLHLKIFGIKLFLFDLTLCHSETIILH